MNSRRAAVRARLLDHARSAADCRTSRPIPGALAHRRTAAWELLVRHVGRERAAFVANSTRPGAAPAGARAADDRTPATARLLPDSWVVVGYSGGQRVIATHVPGVPETRAGRAEPGCGRRRVRSEGSRISLTADDGLALGDRLRRRRAHRDGGHRRPRSRTAEDRHRNHAPAGRALNAPSTRSSCSACASRTPIAPPPRKPTRSSIS